MNTLARTAGAGSLCDGVTRTLRWKETGAPAAARKCRDRPRCDIRFRGASPLAGPARSPRRVVPHVVRRVLRRRLYHLDDVQQHAPGKGADEVPLPPRFVARYGLGSLKEGLRAAHEAGAIIGDDLDAIAHLLLGAMNEAAMWIARAPGPSAALERAKAGLDRLLTGLRAKV